MLLSKPQNDLTSDVNAMPYILHKLDKDGTLLTGPPGLEVYISSYNAAACWAP